MNIEDIKVGETYYVRMKITDIKEKFFYAITKVKGEIERYCFYKREAEIFSPIPPAAPTGGMLHQSDDDRLTRGKNLFNSMTGTKNTETAPKYDPCRKFREGDKVRPVERYGRMPDDGAPVNVICEVEEDELTNGTVAIRARWNAGSVRFRVTALYLELVTPAEEKEQYSVVDAHTHWDVADKNMKTVATYSKGHHPHAKAAAEAECARLNEEYRKEK